MENVKLLEYIQQGGKQIWIGRKTPYPMTAVELLDSTNYRVSSCHHHKYDIVWFYETLLDEVGELGWKIVVDELIRLINRQGIIIFRLHDNKIPSLPYLKKFLGRHIGIQAEVDYEYRDRETDIWTFACKVTRLEIEAYSADDWTFAVLTQGKKVDNVIAFLRSVREYEPNGDSEIIIVGPHNSQYDKYNVRYIDTKQFRDNEYAEISKKKNAVIEAATKANLMIVHDRFALRPNFFVGFSKWGYDFDFVTVSQFTNDNKPYPGYAATFEYMRISGQIWVEKLYNLYANQYLNGGLLILKTHIAKKVMFNSMMMWGQMEDCELAHACMEAGIIPRVNYISEARVSEVSKGYFVSWVMERKLTSRQTALLTCKKTIEEQKSFLQKISKYIPQWMKHNRLYVWLKKKYYKGRQRWKKSDF